MTQHNRAPVVRFLRVGSSCSGVASFLFRSTCVEGLFRVSAVANAANFGEHASVGAILLSN